MDNTLDLNQLTSRFDGLIDSSINFGIKLLIAVLILIIGLWIVKKVTNGFRKIMKKREVEASLSSFLASFINIVLKVLVVIIVLATVGVEMTSIIAILGAASLAIGMALSGTLQNFAGGIVILLFKPFKVGDFIETQSGYTGTVLDIFIFTTKMKTSDNKIIYLPNGSLSNGVIVNCNQEGIRRVDCVYGISYGDNVAKAREVVLNMLNNDERVHKDPAPVVYLTALADSSVNILVRFWTDSPNVFPVQFDLNEKIYNEFGNSGLSFPFPQVDVHLTKQD
ncbi:mechanosensitive ion channel family protein [Dysgonomonas sp. 25]|uniref:mechanosensitive ion channel family protein n=1 Tax=Dysgonomonas sp. 25 TaxID=2302933 RepID=UPI0013D6A3FC|nr:mechanosensitive ion channel domain-containing protein [Dysgonomonas sp. 25]NDV70353.1 mechanosensitive ion channel family protein [Dysgonomonas sp. 25]